MRINRIKTCCLIFLGLIFAVAAFGSNNPLQAIAATDSKEYQLWNYAPDESGMTFVTIYNDDVAEINTFRNISGSVSADGQAHITINLNSVDSADEDRDRLYRSVLFDVMNFPNLVVTAQIDMENYEGFAIGDRFTELLDMNISLRGVEKRMNFYVMVTRLADDRILIENKAPLIINAADFSMTAPLAELQRLFGIRSITPVTTATLSFVFKRD